MENFICQTCGSQFTRSATPPKECPICLDERQYVNWEGQQWTTLAEMKQTYTNQIRTIESHLIGIGTTPRFAIGQRALLVQTAAGNLLWDCISLLDDDTAAAVRQFGGVQAIAISHPHYYSSMVEWANEFNAPIYLHQNDQQHVMRPDPAIRFWQGDIKSLFGNLTLIKAGGHFAGGTILHWPDGAAGNGALLTGDIIQVVQDRRFVSFMYSYPNLIPLSAAKVKSIVAAVNPFSYDRIYGAWWNRVVQVEAQTAVRRSAERYIQAIID